MRTRSFRLSDGLDEALVVEAARVDRSVSWVVVRALEQALGEASRTMDDRGGFETSGTPGARLSQGDNRPASARASVQGLEQASGPSSVSSAPDAVEQTGGRGSVRPASARAPAPSKAPGGYVRLLNPRPKGLRS